MTIKTLKLRQALCQIHELLDIRPENGDFMDEILEILTQLSRGEIAVPREEHQAFLEESTANISALAKHMRAYIRDTEDMYDRTEIVGLNWLSVCQRRSYIEYFRSLYLDALEQYGGSYLVSTENLDDIIIQTPNEEIDSELEDLRPVGTPSSHWWWWWPDPAPGTEKAGPQEDEIDSD